MRDEYKDCLAELKRGNRTCSHGFTDCPYFGESYWRISPHEMTSNDEERVVSSIWEEIKNIEGSDDVDRRVAVEEYENALECLQQTGRRNRRRNNKRISDRLNYYRTSKNYMSGGNPADTARAKRTKLAMVSGLITCISATLSASFSRS